MSSAENKLERIREAVEKLGSGILHYSTSKDLLDFAALCLDIVHEDDLAAVHELIDAEKCQHCYGTGEIANHSRGPGFEEVCEFCTAVEEKAKELTK